MVDAIRNHKPIEGITALDINLGVVEIIEAAKESGGGPALLRRPRASTSGRRLLPVSRTGRDQTPS
jgi:hypothetical protein